MGDMKAKTVLFAAACAAWSAASAATVKIVGAEGSWRLERNGKPYFIRGAGGVADYAKFAAMGGNSVRTWGADKAAEILAAAGRHGVTVTVGFWLPHQNEGANYPDAKWCEVITRSVLETVRAVKDHPGLLLWALGNEMELGVADEETLWKYINCSRGRSRRPIPTIPWARSLRRSGPLKSRRSCDWRRTSTGSASTATAVCIRSAGAGARWAEGSRT